MRDSLLVSAFVLVAVAGIYLLLRTNAGPLASPYNSSATPEPLPARPASKKPAPVLRAVKPKPAVFSLPPEPVAEAPVVSEAVLVPPPPAPVVMPDPPPFPTPDRIAAGVLKDKVTTAYGGPAISAVTSADGHMVETMVYAQKGGRSETVIRLDEGKVSAAYTKITVSPATGVLVPRPRVQP
jgi:hypothetical protein